jgi:bacteriorhodopsin
VCPPTKGAGAAAKAALPASLASMFKTYVFVFLLLCGAYAIVWGTAEGEKVAHTTQEIITYTVLDLLTKVILKAWLLLGIRSYNKYGDAQAWLGSEKLDFFLHAE